MKYSRSEDVEGRGDVHGLGGAGQTGVHRAVLVVVVAHGAGLHVGGEVAGAREQVAGIVEEVLHNGTSAAVCESVIIGEQRNYFRITS